MASSPVRIAVVGVGHIGPRHAKSIKANPSAELVALVDPAPAGPSVAAELETTHFSSVADLLASPTHKPDAAIVCTPNHTHVAVAKELLSGGVHVLVEKPVSSDIASGRSLLEYQRTQTPNVKLLVGHHRRFNAYVVKAKEVVDSGSLGQIIAVNGLWTAYKSRDYFEAPLEWHRDKTAGVVLINLVHDFDILHYLFGPVVRVHAEKTVSQRGYDAVEGAALTLRFQSGVVGTFLASDAVPSPHSFEFGTGENPVLPKVGQDFYRIFGSDATLSVPDMTRWSYDGQPAKSWRVPLRKDSLDVVEATPFDLQVQHFVEVVRGQAEPICSGEAGLQALIVCEAVQTALETAETVDIDPNL